MKKENKEGRVISFLTKKEITPKSTKDLNNVRVSFMADIEYLLFKMQGILVKNAKPVAEHLNPDFRLLLQELHTIEDKHISDADSSFCFEFVEKCKGNYYEK